MLALTSLLATATAYAEVRDLRAQQWKSTTVRNVGTGVVQHFGDDTQLGTFTSLIGGRLKTILSPDSGPVEIKTVDVRLSLPNARIDEVALQTVQLSSQSLGAPLIAAPVAALLSRFSKDKTASAVFCVSIGGKDYLGNDARLFRFGAESELRESVEAALVRLKAAVEAGASSTSPACEPGWEGGQPTQ